MRKDKENVLILTTDFNTKLFLKDNLEEPFNLIERKTVESAIETAETTNLDIVIIEDKIEKALDVVFQLKKRKRLFIVPIILITARLKKSYHEKALKAGVFDFLFPPLDKEKLQDILKKCADEKKRIKKVSNISFRLNKGSSWQVSFYHFY